MINPLERSPAVCAPFFCAELRPPLFPLLSPVVRPSTPPPPPQRALPKIFRWHPLSTRTSTTKKSLLSPPPSGFLFFLHPAPPGLARTRRRPAQPQGASPRGPPQEVLRPRLDGLHRNPDARHRRRARRQIRDCRALCGRQHRAARPADAAVQALTGRPAGRVEGRRI